MEALSSLNLATSWRSSACTLGCTWPCKMGWHSLAVTHHAEQSLCLMTPMRWLPVPLQISFGSWQQTLRVEDILGFLRTQTCLDVRKFIKWMTTLHYIRIYYFSHCSGLKVLSSLHLVMCPSTLNSRSFQMATLPNQLQYVKVMACRFYCFTETVTEVLINLCSNIW